MPGLLIPREQHSDQSLTSFCDVICYHDNDTIKMADTLANETRVKSEERVNNVVMMYSDNNHHDNNIDNENCDEDDDATESLSSSSSSASSSTSENSEKISDYNVIEDNYDNDKSSSYDNIITQYDDDINGCSSPILNDCLWSQAALKPFKIIFQELARHRQRSALPPSSPSLTSIKRLGWIWEDEMSFWKNGAKEEFNATNYSGDRYGGSNEVIYSSGSFPDMAMESRIEFKEMEEPGRECSRIKTEYICFNQQTSRKKPPDCSRRSSLENVNNSRFSGMNSASSSIRPIAVFSNNMADSSLSPSTDYETDSDVEIDLDSNDNNNEYDRSNEYNDTNKSNGINTRSQLGNNQTGENFRISGLKIDQNSVNFSTDSGSSVDTRDSKTRKFSEYVDRIHSYSCRSSSRIVDQGSVNRTNSVNKNCAGGGMVSALNTEVIPDDYEPPRNRIFIGQSSIYNGTVSNSNRVSELSSLYKKRYEIKKGNEFSSSLREELLKKDDRAKRLSMEMYTDASKYNDSKIVENMEYDYDDSYKACSSTSTLSNDDDDDDDDIGSNLTFNLRCTNPYIKQTSCSENVTPYVKKSHSGSATRKFKTLVKSRYRSRGEESERQRRHQHNKLERRRRNGQRNLFGRLEDLIRYHDGRGWGAGEGPPQKMARIHVLVRAARLVRDLQETEKRLEQRLRVLRERNRELRDMCARR